MSKTAAKKTTDARLEKLFYKRDEAAFVLAVSVREIDRLISEQKLSTRPYGRRRVIPAGDVRRLAAEIMADKMGQGAASPIVRRTK